MRRNLSVRMLAILQLIADGCNNADIAKDLKIRESTVKKYVQEMYDVLGADNRAHAVAIGFRQRLLS